MVVESSARQGLFYAAVCVAVLVFGAAVGRADDADPVEALPEQYLPVPARQALPPRDCLRCGGPFAAAPCFDTHRGYLYYGTYPWDDDPANRFNDCPGGQCGYPGAMLSLRWIRAHQQWSAGPHPSRHVLHGPRPDGCANGQPAHHQPALLPTGAVHPSGHRHGGTY